MNNKTTYVLFGVLGLVLALFLGMLFWKTEPDLGPGSPILTSAHEKGNVVPAEKINKVEIVRTKPSESKIVFERQNNRWEMTEPARNRTDGRAVDALVQQVLDARKSEKDIEISMKDAGLENPNQVVTLTHEDGRTWKVTFGESTPGESSAVVYATSSDHPKKPIPVAKNSLDAVFRDVNQFRSRDLLAEREAGFVHVSIQQKGKEPIILESAGETQWRFVKPAYGAADYDGKPGSPGVSGVQSLLNALVNLRVVPDGFVEGDPREARFGLESRESAAWVIEVKQTTEGAKDPSTTTLIVGNKADDKGDSYFARLLDDRKKIVKVSAKELEPLTKFFENPAEIRDRHLVRFDAFKKPEVIRVENASGTIDFIRQPDAGDLDPESAWRMWRGEQSVSTDDVAVMALEAALRQERSVKEFPEGKSEAELGLDKPQARIWIWSEPPEKQSEEDKKANKKPKVRDVKEAIELVFGHHDRDKKTVVVKRTRGGVSTIVTVPDSLLDKAKDGSLAYMDKSLEQFGNLIDVMKLSIERDGKTIEVERKDPKDTTKGWVIKQPKELEGRAAEVSVIGAMLGALNNLRIERWYTLKASEQELKGLGLQPGNVKVSLFLKDREKTGIFVRNKEKEPVVFLFGKESDDKKSVYGKRGQDDAIFLVDAGLLKLLNSDLQELNVFDFKIDDVTSVKFVGWQDVLGNPGTYDLERKAAQDWVAKTPAGLAVNSNNVESLVRSLQRLRADKFVVHKSGPTDAHGLDLKKGALEVEISLKDKKEPLQLMIGKLDGDKFYASSKSLPGDVFQLPRGIFEEVKKAPAYLVNPK